MKYYTSPVDILILGNRCQDESVICHVQNNKVSELSSLYYWN